MVALLLLLLTTPAAAQGTSTFEGRWALLADGRVLAILELQPDNGANGGWRGAWLRPDRMSITSGHEVFSISGPVVRRPLLSARRHAEGLELSIAARAGEDPSRFLFKVVDADHAELGWVDPRAIRPMPLIRSTPQAQVEPQWSPRAHHVISTPYPSNAEMKALFDADQADRQSGQNINWAVVGRRDEERRARTLELMNAGRLRSGDDFWHAAFIFQHGGQADFYLLAHTLAVIAAARGRSDATWIAAATLDRYLQSIDQKQIYGTQFSTPPGRPTTQTPYNRTLISDALREALGVPAREAQETQRAEFERRAREREARPVPPR